MLSHRALSRSLSCFVYFSFAVCITVVVSFIWLERSGKQETYLYGPEVPGFSGNSDVQELYVNRETKPDDQSVSHHSDTDRFELINANVEKFDCVKLFEGDYREVGKAEEFLKSHNYSFKHRDDEEVDVLTLDCDKLKGSRYWQSQGEEESNFPIAFNILFHKNVDQLERLLRVLYRPQNEYCIHIDRKTPENVHLIVERLVSCFDNVFIASQLEIVVYKSFTRLKADINCMRDHIERGTHWRYLINVASSEFPLRTNGELVKILKIYNGANDIHEVMATRNLDRFKEKHFTYIDERTKQGYIIHSKKPKEDPPHGLVITKGNAYNVFSRQFIEFALTDEIASDLLDWSVDTLTPDEHYWATLNNLYSNPKLQTPGGFKGHPDKKPYAARYIGWHTEKHQDRCKAAKYIHNICVFSVADLVKIRTRNELIANKFDTEYDPIAYRCMEEWIYNRTRDHPTANNFDVTFFQRLAFTPKTR